MVDIGWFSYDTGDTSKENNFVAIPEGGENSLTLQGNGRVASSGNREASINRGPDPSVWPIVKIADPLVVNDLCVHRLFRKIVETRASALTIDVGPPGTLEIVAKFPID